MPDRAPERLHRKLRWVFISQAFIASLVMALGLIFFPLGLVGTLARSGRLPRVLNWD